MTGRLYRRGEVWYLDISTGRKLESGRYERIQRKAKGSTKKDAQTELDEILYAMRRSQSAAFDNNYPIRDVIEKWCESVDRTIRNPETADRYKIHVRRMGEHLPYEFVSQLKPAVAEAAIHDISQEFSTNVSNKCLDRFRAALEYAVENGFIASNPLKKAKHLQPIRVKFRRDLTHEEVAALLKCATESYRLMWFAYVSTGARKNEIVCLRVEDVNLEKRQIRLREDEDRDLKTDTATRTIPICEELVEALGEKMPATGYVFPTKNGGMRSNNVLREFKRHMAAALKSLGRTPEDIKKELRRLDIHSLRYTFITELIDGGVNPKVVQQLAGHKDIKTTLSIYAQCRPSSVNDAIANLPWSLKPVV